MDEGRTKLHRGSAGVQSYPEFLDTRRKIVEPRAIARDGRALTLITGFFDPLYAENVRRLRALCRGDEKIVVAVANPENALLPWRARAELVAALSFVDCVIDAAGSGLLNADRMIDEREQDECTSRALVQHILSRHGKT